MTFIIPHSNIPCWPSEGGRVSISQSLLTRKCTPWLEMVVRVGTCHEFPTYRNVRFCVWGLCICDRVFQSIHPAKSFKTQDSQFYIVSAITSMYHYMFLQIHDCSHGSLLFWLRAHFSVQAFGTVNGPTLWNIYDLQHPRDPVKISSYRPCRALYFMIENQGIKCGKDFIEAACYSVNDHPSATDVSWASL